MFKFKKLLSCGKVMFLHLSVILFTGGGNSVQGGLCPGVSVGGSLSKWVSVQGGLCPKGASVQGGGSLSIEGALSGKLTKRLRAAGTHPTGMHSCYRHCQHAISVADPQRKYWDAAPRPLSSFLHVYAVFGKKFPFDADAPLWEILDPSLHMIGSYGRSNSV